MIPTAVSRQRLNTALDRMFTLWLRPACISLLLAGCASFDEARMDYIELDKPGPTAPTEEACISAGGSWRSAGMLGSMMCHFRPTDAGKACTDSTECESRCVTASLVDYQARTRGICDDSFLPYGCQQRVHNGKAGEAVCSD
jgi:hypothetical protein